MSVAVIEAVPPPPVIAAARLALFKKSVVAIPLKKSSLPTFSVEATKVLAEIAVFAPNRMPFWLTIQKSTLGEVIVPPRLDGVAPITRLSRVARGAVLALLTVSVVPSGTLKRVHSATTCGASTSKWALVAVGLVTIN